MESRNLSFDLLDMSVHKTRSQKIKKDLKCDSCRERPEFEPYIIGSKKLMEICKTNSISNYILKQQVKYAAHLVRAPNYVKNKQLLFNANINIKRGRKSQNLIENAAKELHIDTDQLHRVAIARKEEFYLNMINE